MPEKELNAVKNGDRKAFESLVSKFEPLIKKETSFALSRSPEFAEYLDEMKQEALLALYSAACSYKEGQKVTFGLYAKICIHNRIISYVRKLKSRAEKERKSLEAKAYSDRNDEPDEILEALESNERLRRFLSENATEYERQVFALYLQKKS